MVWRYQPVWTEENGERFYSICECYFDDEGKLESWTEEKSIAAGGETADTLQSDLAMMLVDSHRWAPVEFSSLRVGLSLERAIASDQAETLAKNIEDAAKHLK